ncbi:MAG: hypothetical protein ACYC21_04605, partial [Eubacteriales bacterium]
TAKGDRDMLTNQTVEHLRAMKLKGFAEGYLRQMSMTHIQELSFEKTLTIPLPKPKRHVKPQTAKR